MNLIKFKEKIKPVTDWIINVIPVFRFLLLIPLLFLIKCSNDEMKLQSPPTVITGEVTNITVNSATASGQIVDDGNVDVIERGIVISTISEPTINETKVVSGKGEGTFSSNLSGLALATTYHIRAFGTNSKGTSYGLNKSFTTSGTIPTVTTNSISELTVGSSKSGGNVTDDGGSTVAARGVCWSLNPNPTIANNKTSDGVGSGSFVSSISQLTYNKKYYVRAYATNSFGTAYGQELNFTTPSSPVPLNGLVGWWPFNGNANDESGTGNHGTINGATLSTDRFGGTNQAQNFNGNSWIQTTTTTNIPIGNEARTISIWYKGTDLGASDGKGTELFGYGGATCGNNVIMNFDNPDIGSSYAGKVEIQGHCLAFRKYVNQPSPNNGQWHNIVVSYDGDKVSFYINGSLIETFTGVKMNTGQSPNSILTIGKEVSINGSAPYTADRDYWSSFIGSIDDVAIWNRTLTADEILKIYNGSGF